MHHDNNKTFNIKNMAKLSLRLCPKKAFLAFFLVFFLLTACDDIASDDEDNKKPTYTVTFNLNGATGTVPDALTVQENGKATAPEAPTRESYAFDGWYKEAAATNAFDFDTETITADITLYAKWLTDYTVKFNVNGGSGTVPDALVGNGRMVLRPSVEPIRESYAFDGWYKEAAATNVFDFDTEKITADITLYAKWLTAYTVKFNVNDGSGTVPDALVGNGRMVLRPSVEPTREGYAFDDWYKEAAATNAFDFATETITANITLYAKWDIKSYTVTFDLNGAAGAAPTEQAIQYLQKAKKTTDPTREGYTFDGWYKEAAATNAFDFATETITSDITLYAKWDIKSYTVTFELNGGPGTAPTEQTIQYLQKAKKPTDPTRADYAFDGWYKEAAATNVFDFATETITADITLYAKWLTAYTVKFNVNGGSGTVPDALVGNGRMVLKPSVEPTREGYAFDDWYKEAAATNVFDFATETITADITLYAKWVKTYIVTFSPNGARDVVSTTSSVKHQDKVAVPAVPVRNGYVLKWYKQADLSGGVFDFSTPITADITLYASWSKLALEVSLAGKTYLVTVEDQNMRVNIGREYQRINDQEVTLTKANLPADTTTVPVVGGKLRLNKANGKITVTQSGQSTDYALKVFVQPTTEDEFVHIGAAAIVGEGNGVDLNFINTSLITDMRGMFAGVSAFNGDISEWDTSSVTDMSGMFFGAEKFNGDISRWNTSKVTDMSQMFREASAFNGNINTETIDGTKRWDTSSVTDMSEMFAKASAFRGDISKWNTSKVTKMKAMFFEAEKFNGDINTKTIDSTKLWDTSGVTDMRGMFRGASAFKGDISHWNTSKVTNMFGMFYEAKTFNGNINTKTIIDGTKLWDTSGVTDMSGMFFEAEKFNGDISRWNTSSVTDMSGMFQRASAFKGDISHWNTSKVTNMFGMFYEAKTFNGNINTQTIDGTKRWDTSGVTDMSVMFRGASAFKGDISEWDTSRVTNMSGMFREAKTFNGNINTKTIIDGTKRWDTSGVTDMSEMFARASAFKGDISKWNTSKVTNMEAMFLEAEKFNGDINTKTIDDTKHWDTSGVTDMSGMFQDAKAFNRNISKWNTSSVTDMSYMFLRASAFNQDISGWNVFAIQNYQHYQHIFTGATAMEDTNKPLLFRL